jgi:cation diffusion facilitator CzcD-associated flavoprotein CzcO
VPSHLHSYTFAQDEDWRDQFSTRATLMEYFRRCVRDFGWASAFASAPR